MYGNQQVSKRSIGGTRNSGGIGYIILPEGIDREEYISNAYLLGAVTFMTEDFEVYEDVKVSRAIFQDLIFPKLPREYGSLIYWANIPRKNSPIILAIITKSNEIMNIVEGQFLLSKEEMGSVVEISGDAKLGNMNINVSSAQTKGGELVINVKNALGKGKFKVISDGEIDVEAGDKASVVVGEQLYFKIQNQLEDDETITEIKYIRDEGLTYIDQFNHTITTTEDEITVEHADGKKMVVSADDVSFNGGENGGMVIVSDMVSKFNGLVGSFNSLLTQLKAHSHLVSTAGPPVAHTGATTSVIGVTEANASTISDSDIENTDVNH